MWTRGNVFPEAVLPLLACAWVTGFTTYVFPGSHLAPASCTLDSRSGQLLECGGKPDPDVHTHEQEAP